MPLPVLSIPPDTENYSMAEGVEVIGASTDGGGVRTRKDFVGASYTITCQWTIGQADYDTLTTFYYDTLKQGSLPFQIDLYTDYDVLTTHTAQFIPDTFGVTGVSEQTYTVGATLEVTPLAAVYDDDTSYISLYAAYFGSIAFFLNMLAHLCNQVFAATLHALDTTGFPVII